MDNLITIKESFIIVLDSRNASTYNNSSKNSSVSFQFEQPIQKPDACIQMTCSVLNFSAYNSIYNINEHTNILSVTTTQGTQTLNIPNGNYNFNTLQNELYNLNIGYGNIILSLNTSTNIITFSDNVDASFSINGTSTILPIIGGIFGTSYNSNNQSVIMPYQCNFNGVNNINIYMANLNTKNMDSYTKTPGALIQSIQVNPYSPQIIFNKTNDYAFMINQHFFNYIQIDIRDDLNNYINFNNQSWNLTLCFSLIRDVPRIIENTFHNIVLNSFEYE